MAQCNNFARQPCDHKGDHNQHNIQPFCIHTTILLFTFSTVFNKKNLEEMFNTLL